MNICHALASIFIWGAPGRNAREPAALRVLLFGEVWSAFDGILRHPMAWISWAPGPLPRDPCFSLIVALLIERPLPCRPCRPCAAKDVCPLSRIVSTTVRRGGAVAGGLRYSPPWSRHGPHLLCTVERASASGRPFNVVVLYLTMGFRQVSHFFTDIQLALRMASFRAPGN